MCLLFCFVLFWILCCVVCEKMKIKKIVDNKKKIFLIIVVKFSGSLKHCVWTVYFRQVCLHTKYTDGNNCVEILSRLL